MARLKKCVEGFWNSIVNAMNKMVHDDLHKKVFGLQSREICEEIWNFIIVVREVGDCSEADFWKISARVHMCFSGYLYGQWEEMSLIY